MTTDMLTRPTFLWTNERIMLRHNAIIAECQAEGLTPTATLLKLAYMIEQDAQGAIFQLTSEKRFLQIEVDRQADQFMQAAIELDRLQTELAVAQEESRRLSADLNEALVQQWQPVEDETDIDCSCVDPECTSALQVDGSYLLVFCEGAFVQMDLGEYRICKRVSYE